MANNNNRGINVSWGSGDTTLWINPVDDGGFELLDYEYDTARIHEICGGRCYYQSRSGASGAGYIYRMGALTKVGYYRVDTVNPWVVHESVAGVGILFPYASHQADKQELLEKYPVVLLVGEDTIVYTNWYTSFNDTMKALLSGKGVETKTLTRTFVRTNGYWAGDKEEVSIQFANLFGYCKMYPWQWATEKLRNFQVGYPSERPWGIFHVSKLEDGRFVRTTKIGEALYATELLEQDPCEQVEEAPKGWEIGAPNMVYRVREDEVYMVGWELAKPLYEKRIERIARFVPTEERDGFITHARERLHYGKYVEYELTVSKLLFFLSKDEQVAEIRKGIARKVRDLGSFSSRSMTESC